MMKRKELQEYVDPAYAGMIPGAKGRPADGDGGPRVCGDDPIRNDFDPFHAMWTPRMRG